MLNLTRNSNCPMGSSPVDPAMSQTLICIAQQWPYHRWQWVKHIYLQKWPHHTSQQILTFNIICSVPTKSLVCKNKLKKKNYFSDLCNISYVWNTSAVHCTNLYYAQCRLCKEDIDSSYHPFLQGLFYSLWSFKLLDKKTLLQYCFYQDDGKERCQAAHCNMFIRS